MATAVEPAVEEIRPQKKEIEILKVLAEKVQGHVKWYSPARRYGFISRNDDGGDLFVHQSVISAYTSRFPSLRNGEEVEFSVVETNQGFEATCVTGPGGQPVKGQRPMYRRYRTTSEPTAGTPSASSQNELPSGDGTRVRQGGRRPRGSNRRSGGRVRSAGVSESHKMDDDAEHATKGEGDEVREHENGDAAVDGESPNHDVPRQRRRPQRRTPRHFSAPTNPEDADNLPNGGPDHGAKVPVPHGEFRGQPWRVRRPFRARGGFRYGNDYSNGMGYSTRPMGTPYRDRRNQMGDRNGYDRGPRRRGFGGASYPRGPRRRPPASGDQTGVVNGHHSGDEGAGEPTHERVEQLADDMHEVKLADPIEDSPTVVVVGESVETEA